MAQATIKPYTGIIATGALAKIGAPGGAPFATYAISVKGTGAAATSWTVLLEGSVDGVNWTTIATHNATDGSLVWDTAGKPTVFVRANVTALTLGPATDITVVVVAVP